MCGSEKEQNKKKLVLVANRQFTKSLRKERKKGVISRFNVEKRRKFSTNSERKQNKYLSILRKLVSSWLFEMRRGKQEQSDQIIMSLQSCAETTSRIN